MINKLKDSKNHIVTDPTLLLNEEKDFYQNLYCSKVDSNKVDPAHMNNSSLLVTTNLHMKNQIV